MRAFIRGILQKDQIKKGHSFEILLILWLSKHSLFPAWKALEAALTNASKVIKSIKEYLQDAM